MSRSIHMLERAAAIAALATALIACEGPAGEAGPQGPAGPAGADGDAGPPGADGRDARPAADATPWEKLLFGVGGADAIDGIDGWQVHATGQRWVIQQGYRPGEGTVAASAFTTTHSRDAATGRLRMDHQRTSTFFFDLATQGTVIVDTQLGVGAGAENILGVPLGGMLPDRVASLNRQSALLNPWTWIERVEAGDVEAADDGYGIVDGEPHHVLTLGDGPDAVRLYVHAVTGRLSRATTIAADPLTCRVEVEAVYLDWRDVGAGLRAPHTVLLLMDGELVHEETRSTITVNPDLPPETFDWPEGAEPVPYDEDIAARGAAWFPFLERFAHIGLPLEGLQTQIQAVELSPGVWHVLGSHHTLVVEQTEGVVVVDPVLYPERTRALIDWIAETVPGKPITHAVVSHHHSDHAGGVKPLIDAGVPLVVGQQGASIYPRLARADCSADPTQDPAQRPVELLIVPEGGSITLDDPDRPVVLHDAENVHAADLLLPYLPSQRILFTVDVYSPGFPIFPHWAGDLRADIERLALDVDVIAGGHGTTTSTLAELDALLGR